MKKRRSRSATSELKAIRRELGEIRGLISGALPAPMHIYHTGDVRYGPQHRFRLDKCWCEPDVRWDGDYMFVVHRRVQ